jgi:hypothetical protein
VAELARTVEQRGVMSVSEAMELLRPLALAPCRRDYIQLYDSLLAGSDARCALRAFVDSLSPPSWLVHRAPIARFDIVTHAGGFDQSLFVPTGQAPPSLAELRGAVSRLDAKFHELQRVVDTTNGANLDRRSDTTEYSTRVLKSGRAVRVTASLQKSWVVDFSVYTCECWRPQRMGVPCSHAVAAASVLGGTSLLDGFYAPGMHRDDWRRAFGCDKPLSTVTAAHALAPLL